MPIEFRVILFCSLLFFAFVGSALATECEGVLLVALSPNGETIITRNGRTQSWGRTYRDSSEINSISPGFIPWIPPGKTRVLDIGAGEAGLIGELRGRGIDAIGVDILLTDKQKSGPLGPYLVEADAWNLPFFDESFEFVFTFFSFNLELRDTDTQPISEMFRVLRPGGHARLGPARPFEEWVISQWAKSRPNADVKIYRTGLGFIEITKARVQ